MLSQEAIAILVQSSQDNATAMREMANALKTKFMQENKDKFNEASKFIRYPEPFQPTIQEEEASQWQDWKLGFKSWLGYAQENYLKDLEDAENPKDVMDFVEMNQERHDRSEKLHSILVSLLKNRPLKILRNIDGRNGLEAWRQLNKQLAPKTTLAGILGPPQLCEGEDVDGAGAWA